MSKLLIILVAVIFSGCSRSIRLAVPEQFKRQAELMPVKGARSNHISFGAYKTSKIKRGFNIISTGPGRWFFLENLLLNEIGMRKDEIVSNEKDKMHFSISGGKVGAEVYAREIAVTKTISYKIGNGGGIFDGFSRLQQYRYVFSAIIATDTAPGSRPWEMIMTNSYDRRKDTVNSFFTIVPPGDNGFATNGTDTIFIKPLTIQKTESVKGRQGWLPMKILSGYELRIEDGVIAIIDAIDHNIWVYNELDGGTRLVVSGISTALFARRVKDIKW